MAKQTAAEIKLIREIDRYLASCPKATTIWLMPQQHKVVTDSRGRMDASRHPPGWAEFENHNGLPVRIARDQ